MLKLLIAAVPLLITGACSSNSRPDAATDVGNDRGKPRGGQTGSAAATPDDEEPTTPDAEGGSQPSPELPSTPDMMAPTGSTDSPSPAPLEPELPGGAEPAPANGLAQSDQVFRDELLRTYSLTFAPADWEMLQATARDEIYVPAMLSVDGETIGRIAVRYKGAYGTLLNCFDENGERLCPKLSIKLKFDEYDANLRYHGLKRLNLHSSLNDPSHLRERVSYKMFREFGVMAPRSAHARLMIDGQYAGLFNLTEEIDGRFTDFRFEGDEGHGTLYKEVWPSTAQDPAYFTAGQQTNAGAPVTKIVNFAEALAGAAADGLGAVVTRWMDPDLTLRYLAVHQAIKHWDGPLTFYCSESGCGNHNYFFYESPSQNQFTLLPWDTDNVFYDGVPTDVENVPHWYDPPGDCARSGTDLMAPGCDRLVQGFVQLGQAQFRATLGKLLDGPYQVSAIQAEIDRWAAQIDESVRTDTAGPGYGDWQANVDVLRSAIATFHERVVAVRDGQ